MRPLDMLMPCFGFLGGSEHASACGQPHWLMMGACLLAMFKVSASDFAVVDDISG